MKIGSFGKFIFEISSTRKVTYSDLNIDSDINIAEHDMVNVKKRIEWLNDGEKNIQMSVVLSKALGVNPLEELKVLKEIKSSGRVEELMLGGESQGKFLLKSISEEHSKMDKLGKPQLIKLKISFKEYCDDKFEITTISADKTKTESSQVTTEKTLVKKDVTKTTDKKNLKKTEVAGTKVLDYNTGKVKVNGKIYYNS